MIPTFVIALREGVEASLIIGIIAAFLVKEGGRDTLRQMWAGSRSRSLSVSPLRWSCGWSGRICPSGQASLETVVGLVAVAAVTYMIVWMRRHARGIKAALEGSAATRAGGRLDDGAGRDGLPGRAARGL